MMEQTGTLVGVAAGLVVIMGGLFGWLRLVRPRVHKGLSVWVAIRDSLIGRPAKHDSITGRLVQDALPSLGVRMESMERTAAETNETLKHVVELVRSQQQQDQRLAAHESALAEHAHRLQQLEDSTIERIANKAESAQAWKAIAAVAHQGDPMVEDASVEAPPELD